jgi:lipopolysaccharide export system protein LptA
MYVWIFFLLLSMALDRYPMTAQAAEPAFSKTRGDAPALPTTITSNKMTVRNQVNQAIFEGTVVLTRGPLTVQSDKMIVFFQGKGNGTGKGNGGQQAESTGAVSSPSNRSLEKVEAIGHVKITQDNSHATCQKAVYFSTEEKIILTGEPVAWEKGTRVSGKLITIYLAEERSVVEGDSHVRIEGEDQAAP